MSPAPVRRAARARSWALHAGVVVGSAAALAVDRRLRRGRLGDAQVATPVLTAAFYGVVAAVERARPYRDDWRPSADD